MPGEDVIEAEGTVMEVLPNARFRVELANRHQLMALVPRRHRQQMAGLKAGDRVVLGLSPFDLSKGIIQSIVDQTS